MTFEGFRNRVEHVEKLARVAFLACNSKEDPGGYVDCIGTALDSIISDLMDIVDDADKALGRREGRRSD